MNLPYLHLWIDLWFIQVRTSLCYKKFETLTKEYISLDVKLFHKWGFEFSLYSRLRK